MVTPAFGPETVLLDKYIVEEVLGRGGMGVVLRARHVTLDEVVAIKVLSEDVRLSDETYARFVREARAAARLRSKHVARVSDVGKLPDGMPYMVMELLEGRDLQQIVKAEGPIPPSFAAALVIQACEALSEAHALGIVHRDIKPSNLFVTYVDGVPFAKLLDFGIAKDADAVDFSLTQTASMLGTPVYMSPEQLRSSRSVDARTDLWSLGVLLYEVLEGERPFNAETFSELCLQIGVDPPRPMTRTPEPLATIVMRLLDKRPDGRFQSALELAAVLAPFAADQGAAYHNLERMQRVLRTMPKHAGEPVTPIQRFTPTAVAVAASLPTTNPRPRRRGWMIGLTLLVLAGTGITAVVLASRDGETTPTPVAATPDAATAMPDAVPVAVTPDAAIVAPTEPPIAEIKPDKPDRPGKKRKPPPAAGSAEVTTKPTPPTNAGSAVIKPGCDPFGDRHGC